MPASLDLYSRWNENSFLFRDETKTGTFFGGGGDETNRDVSTTEGTMPFNRV